MKIYRIGDRVKITDPESKFRNKVGKLIKVVADQNLWRVEFEDREADLFEENKFKLA